MSVLGNGNVLSTGGVQNTFFVPNAISSCVVWNGSSWSSVGSLPVPVAMHSQVASEVNGDALIHGGLTGALTSLSATGMSGRHDGSSFTAGNDIGLNPGIPAQPSSPRGSHTMTRIYDGSYLLTGGADGSSAFSDAYSWIE